MKILENTKLILNTMTIHGTIAQGSHAHIILCRLYNLISNSLLIIPFVDFGGYPNYCDCLNALKF